MMVTITDIVSDMSIASFTFHHENMTMTIYVIKNNNTGKHTSKATLLALLPFIDS